MKYLIGMIIGVLVIVSFPEFLPWIKFSITETVCGRVE